MKAVSESTWTFQMIIFFMLIFACFLTLVLSYNKAYTIKNRMLSIVEKYEGITNESLKIINGYVLEKGYTTTGKCESGWFGALDLNGNVEEAKESNKYYYCFKENKNNKGLIYYDIQVFYRFNLPVIGNIALYKINGVTKSFVGSNDRI